MSASPPSLSGGRKMPGTCLRFLFGAPRGRMHGLRGRREFGMRLPSICSPPMAMPGKRSCPRERYSGLSGHSCIDDDRATENPILLCARTRVPVWLATGSTIGSTNKPGYPCKGPLTTPQLGPHTVRTCARWCICSIPVPIRHIHRSWDVAPRTRCAEPLPGLWGRRQTLTGLFSMVTPQRSYGREFTKR